VREGAWDWFISGGTSPSKIKGFSFCYSHNTRCRRIFFFKTKINIIVAVVLRQYYRLQRQVGWVGSVVFSFSFSFLFSFLLFFLEGLL
jgi:hypothetical protein